MSSSDNETVWNAVIALIQEERPLNEKEHAALSATRIKTVQHAIVLLEPPDEEVRRRIESDLLDSITSALSQLANGDIVEVTTVPRPEPDPEWIAIAAKAVVQ